ncbi:hypothetical protein [Hymenobacter terrenus]|uniref:hypothetical protein n=1 Tax=Hymenobacter terrenus TaxID=1629124 RepID=UPI0012E07AC4|nr:hypothetical protein [Hymenobacter terrenus]
MLRSLRSFQRRPALLPTAPTPATKASAEASIMPAHRSRAAPGQKMRMKHLVSPTPPARTPGVGCRPWAQKPATRE